MGVSVAPWARAWDENPRGKYGQTGDKDGANGPALRRPSHCLRLRPALGI